MTKDVRIRFTFRLPETLLRQLKCEAKQKGISLNSLILQILWDWAETKI